jgi:signal transduction histidine kinase
LLLLRIQNNLNTLGLTMRDMLDAAEPYPLTAWRGQFQRIRVDLEDAMAREAALSPPHRLADQRQYLARSVTQFWDSLERVLQLAAAGRENEARAQIRLSLQARQSALSTAVSRFLLQNNANERQFSEETRAIYLRAERDVYLLLAAMLVVVLVSGIYLIHHNRRMFQRVADLSERRSDLAQQLISIQENTFRHISRELHDEFGQILTAIGAMLQRADRRASAVDAPLRDDLLEVRGIVQSTLENVRTLSQALHPVILDEAGLQAAVDFHLAAFEKQTGIAVSYETEGDPRPVDSAVGIHFYRVLQEALNNVARHSHARRAAVRLRFAHDAIVLEVEDEGTGLLSTRTGRGMGLVSMRERAELMNGRLEFRQAPGGGALVRLTVPWSVEEVHARV